MKLMMSLCTKGFYRGCTSNPPWTMKHCMMSSFVNTIFKLITKFGVIWQSSLKEEGQSSDIIQDRATKIRGAGLGWIYGDGDGDDGSDNYCTRVRFHAGHWTVDRPTTLSLLIHTYNPWPLLRTQCQDEVRILSGRTQKLKVAKRCWKQLYEHNLMYIYHKQCENMQKIQWKSSNGQIQCF